MVMARRVSPCLLLLLFSLGSIGDVNAHPTDFFKGASGLEQELKSALFDEQLMEENEIAPQRREAAQKIQEILGIRSQDENPAHHKTPPQFMMELYNTIADSNGLTRGRNPYNAKVVRSFIESDNTLRHLYFFNVSGLEMNESVLEAELHLYRKKTLLKNEHASTFASPCYLIRVYQVLNSRSLDVPDFHRLLSVRCVDVHASGWQVFNVKQAVLSWMSGEPNLGFLVTTTNLLEDEVPMEFSRRSDYHHSKQPILVLFNDNRNNQKENLTYDKDAKVANLNLDGDRDSTKKHDRRHGQPEEFRSENKQESEFFQRQKRPHDGYEYENEYEVENEDENESDDIFKLRRKDSLTNGRRRRDTVLSKKRSGIVSSRNTKIAKVLTSMDIYERAAFRQRMSQTRDRSSRRSNARERRSTIFAGDGMTPEQNSTNECERHELYIDFENIGLSATIIAPPGYSAYQCKGVCEPPLRQDQRPTNHATMQAIVHKMGLVEGVERPCCVPTKLLSMSFLMFDDDNVVLKTYEDMVADRCGCR